MLNFKNLHKIWIILYCEFHTETCTFLIQKENYPDIYNHMNSAASTKKKSEQNASAEEFAQDCMKRDGRGQIKVKLEIDPKTEAIAANLLSQSGITRDSFLEGMRFQFKVFKTLIMEDHLFLLPFSWDN